MSHKMSYAEDEEMVKLAFRALDKDGSGTVDTREFKHLMTHIGNSADGGLQACHLSVRRTSHGGGGELVGRSC